MSGQAAPYAASSAGSETTSATPFTLLQLARQQGIEIPGHIKQQLEVMQEQDRCQQQSRLSDALKTENVTLGNATKRAFTLRNQIQQNRRAWKDFELTIEQYLVEQHGIYHQTQSELKNQLAKARADRATAKDTLRQAAQALSDEASGTGSEQSSSRPHSWEESEWTQMTPEQLQSQVESQLSRQQRNSHSNLQTIGRSTKQ